MRFECLKVIYKRQKLNVKKWPKVNFLPDTLRLATGLDYGEGLWSAPVPEVQLVVGGNKQQLSCGMEGQRCDSYVPFCEPTLTTTLHKKQNKQKHSITPWDEYRNNRNLERKGIWLIRIFLSY